MENCLWNWIKNRKQNKKKWNINFWLGESKNVYRKNVISFNLNILNTKREEKINMVDQYSLKKNTEEEIMKRNRKFLSNLSFPEKVGVQKINNFQWKKQKKKQ